MFAKSTLTAFVLAAIPFAKAQSGHWIFGGTPAIAITRIDSVVNPGGLGSHVHAIFGSSGFSNTYSYDTQVKSKCTTVSVQPDLSNYWVPQLYHQDPNSGELSAIPVTANIYYLPRIGPKGDALHAFPAGLRMLAGNTNSHTYNASSFADQAVSYVCLDYNTDHTGDPAWDERPDFFAHNCPDGMRAQVFFPSCWDGVNLDSADHKSHLAYPIQAYNSGDCPDTHPVHLVSLFYEALFSVDQFEYHGNGTWVFANGDTTGRAHHGDFVNGWTDLTILQNAIDNCPNANGDVSACPPLNAVMDPDVAAACVLEGDIVDEPVGVDTPLNVLPGCNAIWDGTGTEPTCTLTGNPSLVAARTPLPTGWTEVGCIAEGTNGRALTAASTKDGGMTNAVCADYCDGLGYKYAGVEFGTECYCGNVFENGASQNTVADDQCNSRCGGNSQYEMCGGPQRLTLLYNPAPGDAPLSSAAPVSSVASSAIPSIIAVSSVSPSSAVSSIITPSAASSSFVPTSSTPSSILSISIAESVAPTVVVASSDVSPATSAVLIVSSPSSAPTIAFSTTGPSTVATSASSVAATSAPSVAATSAPSVAATSAPSVAATSAPSVAATSTPSATAASTPSAAATSTPSSGNSTINGWTSAGCAQDVPARTLNVNAYTSVEDMTIEACIAHCDAAGHTIAGLEYARECYCGSGFVNGGGASLSENACNMPCTGAANTTCGGAMALNIYRKNSASTAAKVRRHKARHFGRVHSGLGSA